MSVKTDISAVSEEELVRRIATDNDLDAFSRLFEIYGPKIKALALSGYPDEYQLAEDVVQEVFEVVWKDAHLFDMGGSKVSTWIFTIVRNIRRANLSEKASNTTELKDVLEVISTMESENPFSSIQKQELQMSVEEKMTMLPKEQFEVIIKTFMEGKSHSEAAEELNIPLGTIKTRIKLALSKLGLAFKDD